MLDIPAKSIIENRMMPIITLARVQRPRVLSVELALKVAASKTDRPRHRAVRGSEVVQ